MTDSEFKKEFEEKALQASNAFDSPKKISEYLIEWAKDKIPQRLSTAYWFDIKEKKQDKGFDIQLVEFKMSNIKKFAFHIGVLVGNWSTGLNLSTTFYQLPKGIKAGIGIGVIVPYDHLDLEHASVAPSLILRF